MIQDIFPEKLHNEYARKEISADSVVLFFDGDRVLCDKESEAMFPLYGELESRNSAFTYLFNLSGTDYFLAKEGEAKAPDRFVFENIGVFRGIAPGHLGFAGITAHHLYNWYRDNRYCGRCGGPTSHDEKERMLRCGCGNTIYPKIAPVVIVGVTSGSKLLMTIYANREYKRYALIAGFVEIGESAEEAVHREVLEEVGVKVKNLRYYKSQPWGFSDSLLFGYYCDLDGEPDLSIDEVELAEACWLEREDIDMRPDNVSLTNEMICHFRDLGSERR
jgi:NAD+ diphosphatase